MPVIPFKDKHPIIHESVWISPTAWVTGEVELAENVSFFFGAVARGDILPIKIGKGTNLQENVLVHTSINRQAVQIGEYVTIGHGAIIHGAEVCDTCIIGMGATLLDGAKINKNCIVGANSLVTEDKEFPEGTLIIGSPARTVRDLTQKELAFLKNTADRYIDVMNEYKSLCTS
ncbi:MAG: gamma carbonic anhydrase family protein [Bdellovibrionota bacterium]